MHQYIVAAWNPPCTGEMCANPECLSFRVLWGGRLLGIHPLASSRPGRGNSVLIVIFFTTLLTLVAMVMDT